MNTYLSTLRVIPYLLQGLFLAFMGTVPSFADEEAFNFFVEACRHSGYNPRVSLDAGNIGS